MLEFLNNIDIPILNSVKKNIKKYKNKKTSLDKHIETEENLQQCRAECLLVLMVT